MPILNRIHFKEESVIRYAWLSLMVWLGRYKICTKLAKLAIHMPILNRITGVESEDFINMVFF